MVQEEIPFKDISYLELWQSLRSMEWKHLCNFGSRHLEGLFCEIILNLDQWCLKIVLIWSSGGPFIQGSGTTYAILVGGIKRNNSVKLFLIWARGSGGDVI